MNWLLQSGIWTTLTSPDLWQGTLRDATPLGLAAIGGVMTERSGVVNIALEGMMLVGAFFAVYVDVQFGNAALGMVGAIIAGGIMALILGFAAIRLKADQIIIGMAVNLVALGLTSYLLLAIYGQNGTPPACSPPNPCSKGNLLTIPDWSIPGLNKIPALGVILFQQSPIVYLMLAIVVLAHFVLFRTTLGLRIRAVGEHPRAADTAGINVQQLRYFSVFISGCLSGLAGGYLSLAVVYSFTDNMTSGRGFIALAAMIVGKWTPFGALGACLLFGFGESIYDYLQSSGGPLQDYSTLVATLPYLITIVALAGFIGRAVAPKADGLPYDPARAD